MTREGRGKDRRKVFLPLFAAVAAAHIALSAAMILSRVSTIRSGRLYKFRTDHVDPYDAFRGRYVALSLKGTTVPTREGDEYRYGQAVYAVIGEDERGFAALVSVQEKRPGHDAYVRGRIGYVNGDKNTVGVNLPFKRYRMNEFEAPKAEAAHAAAGGKAGSETYVTVRVRSGRGAIEGLYIISQPLRAPPPAGG